MCSRFLSIMKKIVLFLLLMSVGTLYATTKDTTQIGSKADSVKTWTLKGQYGLMVNQIAFSNWAAGGESSLSGRSTVDLELKYHKNKFTFDHASHLAYGLAGYNNKRIEKTDDKLDLLFSVGHKISKHLDFTGLTTFKSQFAPGYKYPDDSTLISQFMAPGYFTVSVGLNFKPNNDFQLFISPLSGKMTFVMNQTLANKGAFGVKKAVYDSLGKMVKPGENYLGQLGINIVSSYKKKIMKNIHFQSRLNLYNNYLEPLPEKRWQIDLDWDNQLNFKINEYFATVLYLHLKYDPNVLVPKVVIENGVETQTDASARLQMKESLGIGFTYKIN